jgi:hypothetical protein
MTILFLATWFWCIHIIESKINKVLEKIESMVNEQEGDC